LKEAWDIAASEIIRKNDGVVIAEQLAPVSLHPPPLHIATETWSSINVDESWILPLLFKFNGLPVVSKDGVIVYLFEVSLSMIGA
jgi:hypothetical protein